MTKEHEEYTTEEGYRCWISLNWNETLVDVEKLSNVAKFGTISPSEARDLAAQLISAAETAETTPAFTTPQVCLISDMAETLMDSTDERIALVKALARARVPRTSTGLNYRGDPKKSFSGDVSE